MNTITSRASSGQLADAALINEMIVAINTLINEKSNDGHSHNVSDISQLETIVNNLQQSIPTKTTQLTNDADFAKKSDIPQVDSTMSSTSNNPVRNSTIYQYLDNVLNTKNGGLVTNDYLNNMIAEPAFLTGEGNDSLTLYLNENSADSPSCEVPVHKEQQDGTSSVSTPAMITASFFARLVAGLQALANKANAQHTHQQADISGLTDISLLLNSIAPFASCAFHFVGEVADINALYVKRVSDGTLERYGMWLTAEGEWYTSIKGDCSTYAFDKDITVNGCTITEGEQVRLWVGDKVVLSGYDSEQEWYVTSHAYSFVLHNNGVWISEINSDGTFDSTTDVNEALSIPVDDEQQYGVLVPIGTSKSAESGASLDSPETIAQLKSIGVEFSNEDKQLITYDQFRAIQNKQFRYYFVAKDADAVAKKQCWRIYLCKQLVGIFNVDGTLVLQGFPLRFPFVLS